MGAICNTSTIVVNNEMLLNSRPATCRDNYIKKYDSVYDSYFKEFENSHNLLKYIELTEFLALFSVLKLKSLNNTNALKSEMLMENLDRLDFLSFIDCKILNHHLVYRMKETDSSQIFTDYLSKLYEITGKGLISFASEIKKKGKGKMKDKKVKNYFLLVLAILYCNSDDLTKLEIFFYSFADVNNEIKLNLNLHAFLFVLFLISSFGGLYGIYETRKTYPRKVPLVTPDDYSRALGIYDASDMMEVSSVYLNKLFGDLNGKLNYTQFLEKVKLQDLDWIFSSSGIRNALENKDKV